MPEPIPKPSGTFWSWLQKGSWSVLDQGLFAISNFSLNILLARWLTPEAYGAFTVAFVIFLLGVAVHDGFYAEPMLVFGAGKFRDRVSSYLRVLLAGHLWFALVAGLILGIVAAVFLYLGEVALASALGMLALAQACITFLYLMRRACYVILKPKLATIAGAVYMVLVVGGAIVVRKLGILSGPVAIGVMGMGALICSLGLAWYLGAFHSTEHGGLVNSVRADHWEYGKWASSSGALQWLRSALPSLVLPLFVGLAGTATLRVLYNLAMPALQGFSALLLIALPVLVQARAKGRMFQTARNLGIAFIGLAVLYGLIIVVFGAPLLEWLYQGQYEVQPSLIWLVAVLPIFSVTAGLLMAILRAQERPKAAFQARVGSVGVAATFGVALTAAFSVFGALASELLAKATEILITARLLRKMPGSPQESATMAVRNTVGARDEVDAVLKSSVAAGA